MTHINPNEHSLWRDFIRNSEIKEITANFRVDLLQDVSSHRQAHLLDSLVSHSLTDHIMLVAYILEGRILSLIC